MELHHTGGRDSSCGIIGQYWWCWRTCPSCRAGGAMTLATSIPFLLNIHTYPYCCCIVVGLDCLPFSSEFILGYIFTIFPQDLCCLTGANSRRLTGKWGRIMSWLQRPWPKICRAIYKFFLPTCVLNLHPSNRHGSWGQWILSRSRDGAGRPQTVWTSS